MRWWLSSVPLLALGVLLACRPAEPPAAVDEAEADGGSIRFGARISIESEAALPPDARLVLYVVEADLEQGTRRVVAESTRPAPTEYPAEVYVDIERDSIAVERGYEVLAAIVDAKDRPLLAMPGNRPPLPALGLYEETTFPIVLHPIVTPAPAGETYWLTEALELTCGEHRVRVQQFEDGQLRMNVAGKEMLLLPAVATSGGRFSDGANELWVATAGEWLLILRGETPQACTVDELAQ